MIAAVFAILFAIVPIDPVLRDTCDLVEVNHFYDEHGNLTFDQIIFYDWSDSRCRFDVAAWRMVKSRAQLPRTRGDGWAVQWHENGLMRDVRVKAVRESWTQYDPELLERDYLPKEARRELMTFSVKAVR